MPQLRSNPQTTLKPQDLLLLFKLCILDEDADLSYRKLAGQVGVTKSEVHSAVQRLHSARLLHPADQHPRPIKEAVREFVLHGARYAFPAVRSEFARGMPTSWGAPPLDKKISHGAEPPPVWPYAKGTARGPILYPLYPTVPEVAARDTELYELLALFDALRDGRARERNLAERILSERLA
jgi:hypothetical protein